MSAVATVKYHNAMETFATKVKLPIVGTPWFFAASWDACALSWRIYDRDPDASRSDRWVPTIFAHGSCWRQLDSGWTTDCASIFGAAAPRGFGLYRAGVLPWLQSFGLEIRSDILRTADASAAWCAAGATLCDDPRTGMDRWHLPGVTHCDPMVVFPWYPRCDLQ